MPSSNRIFFYAFCLFFTSIGLHGQSVMLSGDVVDRDSGEPIFGALVYVLHQKSATNSIVVSRTLTDIDGKFSLSVLGEEHQRLVIRHLGYQTLEQKLAPGNAPVHATLQPAPLALEEIVISSLRNEKTAWDTPLPVGVMTRNQWDARMPMDLPEVITYLPGVTLSGDGPWSKSVQIRGLGEDRYVSMVDGNRIETAHDLAGALSTIDMADVERVEVIKGALSTLYGSGAMGGVVNIITRQADYSDRLYVHGKSSVEYHSVNRLAAPRLTITSGHQDWKAKFHAGYRKASDAQSPEGAIDNSHFSDWNISASVDLIPRPNHELTASYQQFRGTAGIPGGSVLPGRSEATYLDADRNLLSVGYGINSLLPSLTKLKVRYYRQQVVRNVEIKPNVSPRNNVTTRTTPVLLQPSATHITDGMLLESHWHVGNDQMLTAGVDIWQRRLESRRKRHLVREQLDDSGNVLSKAQIIRGEIPIPNSAFKSAGFFAQYDINPTPRWTLNLGGRLDWIRLSNEEARDPDYLITENGRVEEPPGQIVIYQEESLSDVTWALNGNALFRISQHLHLTGSVGRSYRAPSLEERYKYIDLGYAVEMGNPELKPEQGNFFDTGLKINTETFKMSANLFLNVLNNMIVMAPADSTVFWLGDGSGTTDAMYTRRYRNIDRAKLAGFDFDIYWQMYAGGSLYGNLSFVRATDSYSGNPLAGIAPLNGLLGIRQQLGFIGFLEVNTRFYNRQHRVAEGEQPTDGYVLLNGYVQSRPIVLGRIQWQLSGGIENMLNTRYRNHLATNRGDWMLEPGRNVKFKLSFLW